ncbi:hypothetical protein FNV43_RR17522 [Rhamnella rubrinervis]|uniref:Uncharacterized protein n=1 Tax=Rhamnella rubrinervis TaxID=2594499 RepID=A0A8K0E2R1_9ROSA|nr:hypothetical protein FNV43_RR17522 [Rhamnella rubrinervis]
MMGWSESGGEGCKKHQSMKKSSPGVCSFCLRERLLQLCAPDNTKTLTVGDYYYNYSFPSSSSSQSSSIYDVVDVSPGCRPQRQQKKQNHHHRNVSEVMGSIPLMFSSSNGGGCGLKKSRSLAFVAKAGDLGDHDHEVKSISEKKKKKNKKAEGFWSKLLGKSTIGKIIRNKDHHQLFNMHSKTTVRERLV